MCTTACSSSHLYPATSHSHWRGVGQHSTGHNQLHAKDLSRCLWQMVVTPHIDCDQLMQICFLRCEIHRLVPNEFISIYFLKGTPTIKDFTLMLRFIFLFSVDQNACVNERRRSQSFPSNRFQQILYNCKTLPCHHTLWLLDIGKKSNASFF